MKSSFSSSVKEAVGRRTLEELGILDRDRGKFGACCSESFLTAAFQCLGREEGDEIVLRSGSQDLLEICALVLIRFFDREARVLPRKSGFTLRVPRGFAEGFLARSHGDLFQCQRCPSRYLQAAFLSCGTVLDPAKGYHAAFRCRRPRSAENIREALTAFGITPRTTAGDGFETVYLKGSEEIEDLLVAMGAQKFSVSLMERKVEKSVRNQINRRQNFESANLQKTVDGAVAVIGEIRYLSEKGVLSTLPEPLQQAALARLEDPEASLKELCHRLPGGITKSGLNHRLQKLCRIAREEREKEQEA